MLNENIHNKSFSKLHILVVGDAMIDTYYHGRSTRKNPEANTPILDVDNIENRLGGAANVALNINSLGAQAHLMCFEGNDEKAKLLTKLLTRENIQSVPISSTRKTTVKTRVYNEDSYLLRIDEEETTEMNSLELTQLKKKFISYLAKNKIDAVVLQDYNKGFFTLESIHFICGTLKELDIPFAVDPKVNHFFNFEGATLFKPNLKEINVALNSAITGENENEIVNACKQVMKKTKCENVLVTLAEYGALALNNEAIYRENAHKRNVVDVSGAGDTVIATASLFLALKMPLATLLYYSNLAGGLVIEERGVKALGIEKLVAVANK